LKEQKRELGQVKAPSAPPSKKCKCRHIRRDDPAIRSKFVAPSKAWDEDQVAKKEIDFDNWKPIPVDSEFGPFLRVPFSEEHLLPARKPASKSASKSAKEIDFDNWKPIPVDSGFGPFLHVSFF
jgi:hypothetical protein